MITAQLLTLLTVMLQVPVEADSGSRIRITVNQPSKRLFTGTLVSVDADSLRFTDTTGVAAVPIASVARLERSRGRRSNAGRGALIGGLIGGGAGLLLGIAASAEEGNIVEVGPEEIVVVTAIMGAAGAGLGALIGSASKRERWEPMPVP